MAVSIKHNFVSPVTDEHNPNEVGPDEWNDEHLVTGLATVAETGSYNDLSDKPSLATVATTGAYSDLTGTPSLATVATTGAYSDLSGTPTLGTAAALDAGTADGNVVQVQTGGKLPALDGSLLTGLSGGGDMSKSTYDPTNKAGDAFSQDNMADGTTNKNYTATEQTKLSGIEASADVTDATNVAAAGAFMKSADDSDDVTEGAAHLFMTTSERSKLSGIEASADVTDAGNVGSTIHGATGKTTPVDADELALIDSAASNVLKKLTWANLKATLNAVYQPLAAQLTSIAAITSTTDNTVPRFDGTGGNFQKSGVVIDDSDSIIVGASINSGRGVSTGDCGNELGIERTGSGNTYFDVHTTAKASAADYECRFVRNSGANGTGGFQHSGTGDFFFQTDGAAMLSFRPAGTEKLRLAAAGNIYYPGIGTTGSGANAFLNSGSTPTNELLRSTSSLVYKRDVETLEDKYADDFISRVRPVWYRSKIKNDNQEWSWYGLIAEEVAAIDPRFVHYGYQEDAFEEVKIPIPKLGKDKEQRFRTERRLKKGAKTVPDGVMYDRIVAMLINKIQRMETRLAELEGAASK